MKKLLLLMLVLIMAMSMTLTACTDPDADVDPDDPNNPPAGDTPGDGGNDGDDEKPACEHVGTLICEKCYSLVFDAADVAELPEFETVGMKVTNLKLIDNDDYSVEFANTVTAEIVEGYLYLGENGMLQGYGTAKLNAAFKNYDRKETTEAYVIIEDNVLYISASGGNFSDTNEKSSNYAYIDITEIQALKDAMADLEGAEADGDKINIAIEYLENTILPLFGKVDLSDLSDAVLKNYAKLVNSVFKAEKSSSDISITVNYDAIKSWNKTLSEKTAAEAVDLALGEGTFASIEKLITDGKLYNFSVADLISYLQTEQGIYPAAILDTLDGLIKLVTEDPEATLESLLAGIYPEADIPDLNTFLTDEEFLAYSVKDALALYIQAETPEEAVETFKEMAESVIASLKEMSVYEFILSGNTTDEDVDNSEAVKGITDSVNDVIDMISDSFSFEINASAKGKLQSISLALDVPDVDTVFSVYVESKDGQLNMKVGATSTYQSVSIDISYTGKKFAVSFEYDNEESSNELDFEIIPDGKVQENSAKLAEIKAAIAKADGSVNFGNVYDALASESFDYYGRVAFADNAEGLVYVASVGDSTNYWDGTVNYVNTELYITVFDAENYFGLAVGDGCRNIISVSPVFNTQRATVWTDIEFDHDDVPSYEITEALTLDILKTALEGAETSYSTESVDFLYDTATKEISFNEYYDHIPSNGHVFVLDGDTSNTADESCGVLYYEHYICENCEYDYYYYYSVNHNLELDDTKTVFPETCNTEYTEYYYCTDCDFTREEKLRAAHLEEYTDYVFDGDGYSIISGCKVCGKTENNGYINIYSDIAYSDYTDTTGLLDGGTSIAFTVDESTAGTYAVYGESDSYLDTKVTVYFLGGNNAFYFDSDDDNGGNGQFYVECEFEAGVTYIINAGPYFEAYDCNFTLWVEKI